MKDLLKNKRIFIIPLDHPILDTPRLNAIGKQNFVNLIDHLSHDAYIFHSLDYFKNPLKTKKNFFLTAGELPDNYKADPDELAKHPEVKNITIFFDVQNSQDEKPFEFYKDYVVQLKQRGYFVMAMGFPSEDAIIDDDIYTHIINIASRLGCDAIKTDLFDEIENADLNGMYLFIGGGPYLTDQEFQQFLIQVEALKTASASFGRNIFEAENYIDRINLVKSTLSTPH